MSFLDELQKETNKTRTENGALTNASSLDPLLDFFSLAGAMRDNQQDAIKLFTRAYAADRLGAVRTLFYLRDIRGGQGERDLFRILFDELATVDAEAWHKVLKFIPEYGRWDDLIECGLDADIVALIKQQLDSDAESMAKGESVSLLAKWLPSENTSSRDTQHKAKALATALGLKSSQYRKKIVALRKHIKLLEQKMSANQWAEVEYEKLPSQAHRKHVKAFHRHDEGRYSAYLEKATKGEAKMNTATLFTYEVMDAIRSGNIQAANAMWANLPDYTNGSNALVMADVSGSMYGRPIDVSVSLALYFAEHNKGLFQGYFMTFSERPELVRVLGATLVDKLSNIQSAQWGMNTNLEAAFLAILESAKGSAAKGDDMPKILYIISDMEFDSCVKADEALFDNAKREFTEAGFKLPHVVFWNVNARQIQAPATKFDNNVTLISGLSQSTFRYAVEGKTPVELMRSVIDGDRYAQIVL